MPELVPNARLELLRRLAWFRDYALQRQDPYWPTHLPLWLDPWENDEDDVLLALRECELIGEVAVGGQHPNGPAAAITDLGYDRIRAHDALGEITQETAQ